MRAGRAAILGKKWRELFALFGLFLYFFIFFFFIFLHFFIGLGVLVQYFVSRLRH